VLTIKLITIWLTMAVLMLLVYAAAEARAGKDGSYYYSGAFVGNPANVPGVLSGETGPSSPLVGLIPGLLMSSDAYQIWLGILLVVVSTLVGYVVSFTSSGLFAQ
jgi:hypothetical protein